MYNIIAGSRYRTCLSVTFQRFSLSVTSLSQSTLTSFLKRPAPETHDADDGTSNDVHSKKKKSEDNKKKYETKRIRKFRYLAVDI